MTKSILVASCALSLVACVKQDEAPNDAIAAAIPTSEQVRIKLPTGGARSVGELAQWYVATRGVTTLFNGGSAWVLAVIHTIVKYPVTSVNGNVYTWGPWSDALDPAEYKLDVVDVGDGTYTYELSGRNKTSALAQFEVVIDGVADPRPGELQGNGAFQINFDAARRVNPIDVGADARGSVQVDYDLAARHLELAIASTNANGEPVFADYAYNETAAGGGDMVFSVDGNAGGTTAMEQITLRSRWLPTGAGRADARIAGGDLATGATGSECWDTRFARVYYTDSVNFAPTEGNTNDCAFATADLPPAP